MKNHHKIIASFVTITTIISGLVGALVTIGALLLIGVRKNKIKA